MPQTERTGDDQLARLLYVSDLAPGTRASEVSRIVASSRRRNTADGLTGLLIFDGDRFCQYVEGPPAMLETLRGRLDADARHVRMETLIDGAFAGPRRFSDWRLGYVQVVDTDDLDALRSLQGEAAMAAFERLLPLLDVDG